MALPEVWVDHLFSKLLARYGARWLGLWEGVPINAVRSDWAQVLDGMSGQAIEYALAQLPDDFPPTSTAFRALGNRRPDPQQPLLPAPHVSGPAADIAIERMRNALGPLRERKDPRAWAHRLAERHKRGDRLTIAQVEMYSSALKQHAQPRDETVEW